MKVMKLASAGILLSLSTTAFAAKLNVPDDFPNSFHMDLLSGSVFVDFVGGTSALGEIDVVPSNGLSQILFDATSFDGFGPGEGTSDLTLTSTNQWDIATFNSFGFEGRFFLNGNGAGTLVDNGDGSGEWALNIPLFAEWNNILFEFSDFSLSTSASYSYTPSTYYDAITGQQVTTSGALAGVSMDYETGDAFLVGQSTVTEVGHPFEGLRITLGMNGNDPVLLPSAVPVPAAVWLFGSGLVGLVGFARRNKA